MQLGIVGLPYSGRQSDRALESFYSFGHPLRRYIDFADGYVNNPESGGAWKKRAEDLANPFKRPAWRQLADRQCVAIPDS